MPVITAAQHIYTNVERDQSPEKTAGFQTLFYTHDRLTKDDIFSIEERVFYKPTPDSPPKRFFFVTPSGKWVIGQIVAIEGRDQAGRSGLYLAHSLIVASEEMLHHDLDPILVLQSAPFIQSREEGFKQGNASTGHINALTIDIDSNTKPDLTGHPLLRACAQLAINAPTLKTNRTAVAFTGTSRGIEALLKSTFALLPAEAKAGCTFDTSFDHGGNLSFTYCWATGHEATPRQPFYINLNADATQLADPVAEATPKSYFGRWVDTLLTAGRGNEIPKQKEAAAAVASYLDGNTDDDTLLDHQPDTILTGILDANQAEIRSRIREQVAALLPETLVDRLFESLLRAMSPRELIRLTPAGFSIEALLDQLFHQYKSLQFQRPRTAEGEPDHAEIDALKKTAKSNEHQALTWLALAWDKDIVSLRKALIDVSPEDYDAAWTILVENEQALPIWFLVKQKERKFAEKLRTGYILNGEDTAYTFQFFLKQNMPALLDTLIPSLRALNEKQLRKAHKLIKEEADVSEEVRKALLGAMTQQDISPDDGFFKRWF